MFKKFFILTIAIIISLTTVGCSDVANKKEEVTSENLPNVKTQDWKESPLFESNGYTMIGEEGRLGFIYDDSEVTRFYPNKVQKYMWHFWGNEKEFNGGLKVIATHETGGEPITVLEGLSLGGPNNGADHHVPSNMSLPKSGMWKLDAYIGNKLFGSIFVKVYEK
ncbi:DUF4871 domain-containing protein [Geobacillus sp. 44C]|jgi:hypothetical protein|nr:DUF4871 domain-containing protein [Geobacillus sp. 44C]